MRDRMAERPDPRDSLSLSIATEVYSTHAIPQPCCILFKTRAALLMYSPVKELEVDKNSCGICFELGTCEQPR